MGEKRDDLRATGEDLIADAEELKRMEQRKIELGPDNPESERLADDTGQLLREMHTKARVESDLADEPDDERR